MRIFGFILLTTLGIANLVKFFFFFSDRGMTLLIIA